ncbi:WXG100-like domain-containing protein [Plantactinospora soyae]|uniref:Outer membrane channel protein CpnT-like N-terminal domain-containing protein n=1 Tax=Plantactinospora soyae TaxID=1544732 RepID=A0A927M3V8_9ACTN|nr:hypothetical protein [Plantactinospora soyae]MBE1487567.1 hypothetical protein [Plantactinospora soyae]
MSIELPHHLGWVHELCGSTWLAADEDRLFDLARRLRMSAAALRELDQDVDLVARDVVANNDAESIYAFGQTSRRSHYNHQLAAQATDLIGDMAVSLGLAIQAAKITLLGVLGLTATRIVRAKAAAQFVPGTSADEAFEAAAAGRVAIAMTLRRLQVFIEVDVATHMRGAIMETLVRIKSANSPSAAEPAPDEGQRAAAGAAAQGYDATPGTPEGTGPDPTAT